MQTYHDYFCHSIHDRLSLFVLAILQPLSPEAEGPSAFQGFLPNLQLLGDLGLGEAAAYHAHSVTARL